MKWAFTLMLFCIVSCVNAQDAPNAAVQIGGGGVVCVGYRNELQIAVEGVNPDSIIVTTKNGTITRNYRNFYDLEPDRHGNNLLIDVAVRTAHGIKPVKQIKMRCVCPPAPDVCLMGMTRGAMNASMARASVAPQVPRDCFALDMPRFHVTSFRIAVVHEEQIILDKVLTGNNPRFSDDKEVSAVMSKLEPGDKLMLTNIRYKGPGDCTGQSPAIYFNLY